MLQYFKETGWYVNREFEEKTAGMGSNNMKERN
jgi:hypothetical protein